jgi:hypothetical protein
MRLIVARHGLDVNALKVFLSAAGDDAIFRGGARPANASDGVGARLLWESTIGLATSAISLGMSLKISS